MKTITLVLAVAAIPFLGGTAANAASDHALTITAAAGASQTADASARRKVRRHVHRSYYLNAYGYDRPYGPSYYGPGYYRQGYYRGVRPGWGYGPDPGDRAWPPFHFKPYW